MASLEFQLPREKVGPAWELFLGECATRGVLFRRGGLNMMNFSHQPEDIERTVRAAAEAFDVLRANGFTGELAEEGSSGGQQVGPWSANR